jgi:hypothetical protein
MTVLARFLLGGGLALAFIGSALAEDTAAPAAPTPAVSEHDRLIKETVCRNLDDDDTGSHVRHKTCKTRGEWLAIDKSHKADGYDPDTGRAVVKE